MKNFVRYSIAVNPFNADLISGVLWQLPINGLTEETGYLNIFAEENSGLTRDKIENLLKRLVDENVIESYDVSAETFADRNWNEEWEKNIRVVEVTENLVIKPTFKEYTPKQGQVILEIDPKMSFGTGEHASTRLVLKLMGKYTEDKHNVLDVGTGTGVLAIYAAKLGVERVIAIDNNEWCFVNSRENLERNNVADKIDIRMCEISGVTEGNFDLILANINKNVLREISDDLSAKLAVGGILILSGILIVDKNDIVQIYNKTGLKLVDSAEEEEWTGLVFTK